MGFCCAGVPSHCTLSVLPNASLFPSPGVAPSAPARESPAAPAADPDTRAASELLRLQREREALLRTGVYSTLAAASGHGALGGGCI